MANQQKNGYSYVHDQNQDHKSSCAKGGSILKQGEHAPSLSMEAEFVEIQPSSMDALIRLLEARLPRSANINNCAKYLSRAPGEFQMYTLRGDLSASHAWVLVKLGLGSFGAPQLFLVSAPNQPSSSTDARTLEVVRQSFIDTAVIDWDADFEFIGLDSCVGGLVTDISTFVKGRVLGSHPNLYYTMSTEDALRLELPAIDEHARVRVQPLDTELGAHFITSSWKYTRADGLTAKYVRDMISRHPSTGVYIEGVPVAGVISHTELLIGMLSTDPAHRNKGYALVCMKNHLRNLAQLGYVPASCVENRNEASKRFHEKVGMRVSHGTVDLNTMGM